MAGMIRRSLPEFGSNADRIAWIGDRIWDVTEGILDKEDATFIMWLLDGWVDTPTYSPHDRDQFTTLLAVLRATMALRFDEVE